MSSEMQNTVIYYAVYYARYDGTSPYQDLLYELRKGYFSDRKRLKNKIVREIEGVSYRYSYHLESGNPMKWKKLAGYKLLEKSFSEQDGSYQIVTQDLQKRLVKATFFDSDHQWLRTEYFAPEIKKVPAAVFSPSPTDHALRVKEYASQPETENIYYLYPCEIPQNKEELKLLNSAAGIPEVICRTSEGEFYYCRQEEVQRRKAVLDAIRNGNQAKPLFTPERHLEDEDPNPDRSKGFSIDQNVYSKNTREDELLLQDIGEQVKKLKEEVQKTIQQHEMGSYQWGTGSLELEQAPERLQEEKHMTPELEASQEKILPDQEYITAQLEDTQETSEKHQAYDYDTVQVEPEELLTKPGQEEKQETQEPVCLTEDIPEGVQEEETICCDNAEPSYRLSAGCNGVVNGCPYMGHGKMRIDISENESYYYFGNVNEGLREGRGRTAMQTGETAYEGNYLHDKREGFGTYYYKTGKLCYAGNWKANQRQGTGVSFRPSDGTIHVGRWEKDVAVGMGSRFDENGNLLFAGKWKDGKRQGAGVTYHAEDGRIFVGQWKDDVLTGKGTEFDGQGNLLYTGGWKNCKRNGFGTQYSEDGNVIYSGNWKDNQYEGAGTLHFSDGRTIQGEFSNGEVCGKAAEFDPFGFKVYEGTWQNGHYHGEGCKFFQNGGRYEGTFDQGEPKGRLKGYDAQGELVYEGEWKDDEFNGEGCYYFAGEKVYEGAFLNNCYHGHGYQYQNGNYVFSGNFVRNMRSGFGCSYDQGVLQYAGMWENNLYHGYGILYEEGTARFAGEFRQGKLHGRVNRIIKGIVCEEGVYDNDQLIYAKRYHPDTGTLIFEGNIQNNKPNGMGCVFTPYGEKKEEGIFVDGKLQKSMKVNLRSLPALPDREELSNTEYADYIEGPVYAIEQSIDGGVYSGQLKNGRPHGKGTMLRKDHRYTGCFVEGVPSGKGILYQDDGTTLAGSFSSGTAAQGKHVVFADGQAYDYVPININEES